jgi:hypothetical protein
MVRLIAIFGRRIAIVVPMEELAGKQACSLVPGQCPQQVKTRPV